MVGNVLQMLLGFLIFFGNFMGLIYVKGNFLGITKGCFQCIETREKYLLRSICGR